MAINLSILVIENSPEQFQLIDQQLEQIAPPARPHRVTTRDELEAALDLGGWDAVVSNYGLPDFDFPQILKAIRSHYPDLPLVLVSAPIGEENLVEWLKSGLSDFVLKDHLTRLAFVLGRTRRDAAQRHARASASAELRDSRIAALNMMEDADEARRHAEDVSARLRQEIAGHKETVHALREQERQMTTLFSNLPGMAYRCSNGPQWTMAFVSEGSRDLTGYSPADLVENSTVAYGNLIHADDREEVWRQVQTALKRRQPFRIGYRISTACGEERWVWEQGRGVFDEAGTLLGLEGFVTDVSVQRHAELALQRSQALLSQAGRMARLGAWELDVTHLEASDASPLWWSEEVFRIFGYSSKEVEPSRQLFFERVHPEDRGRVMQAVQRSLDERRPYEIEHRIIRPDGTERVVLEHAVTVFDDHDGPLRMIGAVQDITARKAAEQAVRNSEARYRELVESANSAILRFKRDGTITFFNEFAQTLFGYPAEEVLGRNVDLLLPEHESEDHDLSGLIRDIFSDPDRFAFNINENVCRDGRRVWMAWSNKAILDPKGEVAEILAVGSDITEQRRAEAKVRQMSDRLQLAARAAVVGVWDYDLVQNELVWDEAMYRLYGVSRNEFGCAYEAWQTCLHPEDRHRTLEEVERALRGEQEFDTEFRVVWPDGSIHYIKATGLVQRDATGRPVRMLGTNWDITESKRAAEALAQRTRHASLAAEVGAALARKASLRDVLQACTEAMVHHLDAAFARIWTLNPEGNILELQASAGMYTHLDGPHGRVTIGDMNIGRIAAENRPHLTNDVAGDPRIENPDWAQREGMAAFAGYPLWVEGQLLGAMALFTQHPLSDAALDALGATADTLALGIERKRMEEALRASEERHRILFEDSRDAIMVATTPSFRFIRANPATFKMFGVASEAVFQSLSAAELSPEFQPDGRSSLEAIRDMIDSALRQGSHSFEWMHRRLTGEHFPASVTFTRMILRGQTVLQATVRDITVRKRIEEAFRQRMELQNQLTQIAATVPGTIYSFRLRPDGTMCFPYASPTLQKIFGVAPEQVRDDATSAFAMLHPDDLAPVQAGIGVSAQTLKSWRAEFRVRGAWQGDIWVEGHAVPQREPDGGTLWHGFLQDISERKRSEEQLRKLSRAVEQSPASVMITNAAGDIEYVNPRFVQVTGYSFEEVRGRNPRLLKGAETTPEDYRRLWRTITAGGAWHGVFHNRRKDGQLYWEYASISPVLDEQGRITHFLGIKEDITERIRLQSELAHRKRELDSFFTAASAGMVLFDKDLCFVRVNQALADMNGLSIEAHIGKSIREVVPRLAPIIEPILREVLATGQPVLDVEVAGETASQAGIQRNWVESFFAIAGDSGLPVGVGAVIVDISELKRLELERAAMEVQLRQQQRLESVGTLASGVAHEINNPINGIMNYAQLIQDRLPSDSPLAEFTGEILHETQRVATIVRNLLTFSRTDKQSHSPARVVDIVESTLSLIRTVIRHDQITLEIDIPEDLPELNCRSQQIQQVLMNLMTNARDALNERYPGHDPNKILKLTAGRFEREGRRWVRISVEDHGMGISPKVRERMFDPFFTTKPRDKGTGLGLSISHGILKEHHGDLIAETELDRFTRFHVELPVRDDGTS